MALCAELVLPAVIAASLTNDLFSYEKEYEAAQAAGHPDVVNALWVLMSEHKISLEEAKAMCRIRIKKEVAQYVHIVRKTQSRGDLSSDAKRYIGLMQYSVSGNVVWSLQCPRYHRSMQYNERQLLREKYGVAKYPATYQLAGQNKRARMDSLHTFNARKKMSAGVCPDVDEGIRQNGHPTETADILCQSCEARDNWDVLNGAQGQALPKLGHEVSTLGRQPLHLCTDQSDRIGTLSLCQLATIEGNSRHGDRRPRDLAGRLAAVHCYYPKCGQDDPQQLHHVSAEPQLCVCLPRLTLYF